MPESASESVSESVSESESETALSLLFAGLTVWRVDRL